MNNKNDRRKKYDSRIDWDYVELNEREINGDDEYLNTYLKEDRKAGITCTICVFFLGMLTGLSCSFMLLLVIRMVLLLGGV